MQKIGLGDKVKDRVTSFEGIVVETIEFIHGCTRLGIQSQKLNEKDMPLETCFFDEPQLELVQTNVIPPATKSKSKLGLGDKVKDPVTEHVGIITGMATYLNGCIRCGVQSNQKTEDGQPNEAWWFDEPRLTLIKDGAIKRGSRETGGPISPPQRDSDLTR